MNKASTVAVAVSDPQNRDKLLAIPSHPANRMILIGAPEWVRGTIHLTIWIVRFR